MVGGRARLGGEADPRVRAGREDDLAAAVELGLAALRALHGARDGAGR